MHANMQGTPSYNVCVCVCPLGGGVRETLSNQHHWGARATNTLEALRRHQDPILVSVEGVCVCVRVSAPTICEARPETDPMTETNNGKLRFVIPCAGEPPDLTVLRVQCVRSAVVSRPGQQFVVLPGLPAGAREARKPYNIIACGCANLKRLRRCMRDRVSEVVLKDMVLSLIRLGRPCGGRGGPSEILCTHVNYGAQP